MQRLFVSFVLSCLLFSPFASSASTFNPNFLISDEELLDTHVMTLGDIQLFLEKGSLANYRTTDIDGGTRTAAEIIYRAARRNGVSPRVILVMLQKEQSLVMDPSPSADQLDWAMGYGVCDACSHDDPNIQRFRGFGKQVNSSTLQIVEGYLQDLALRGQTVMGFAPGEATTIDDTLVIPANNATAALYTYTPHLHGNQVFTTLWQRWFARDYPTGSLLQNKNDGGVWLIQYGERRPITSRAAFLSRYTDEAIIAVSPSELEAYSVGRAIALPNYSLLHAENGDIYLLVDDVIRHIDSMEAFRAIGFNEDDLVNVSADELDDYETGEPITIETTWPQGVLLQDVTTGGVYYVENNVKQPIFSREILAARFALRSITPSTPDELDVFKTGDPVLFPDGALVGIKEKPDVYFISEGQRRPIASGEVFEAFGWRWENVLWSDERSVSLHPLGDPLDRVIEDEEDVSIASIR